MAKKTGVFTCRINSEDKMLAEKYLRENEGLTLSMALEIYLREIIRVGGIPFELKLKDYRADKDY